MTQEEQEEDRDLTDVELSDKDAVKVIFFLIFFHLYILTMHGKMHLLNWLKDIYIQKSPSWNL